MMIAYTNSDVRILNHEIRSERRSRGEIDAGFRVDSKEFSKGDRILFKRNERRRVFGEDGEARAVQNGTLGTLLEVGPDCFTVELDSGARVSFDPSDYRDIDHGYAVTLYKAQGVTVDRAYILADRHLDSPGWTVAATRHRHDVAIQVPSDQLLDLSALEE